MLNTLWIFYIMYEHEMYQVKNNGCYLTLCNKNDLVTERFLGIAYVLDTSATSLKATIEAMFPKYGLSLSRVCGECFDGANNIRSEFSGLKTFIMRENESAYYIHC
ncbi:Uncharacterized protein TCM_044599 [Theobroma cacao]|uniref:DUF4371 domain-containing protein n=1 Tax=Theobroma cacao TaxID=3641 RepID=A0A061FRD5_THECC|nr:Uncharacterized protein TCM_044599 [Theobroma cacao]